MSQVKRVKGKWTYKHLRWCRYSKQKFLASQERSEHLILREGRLPPMCPVKSGLSRAPPRQRSHLCSAGGLRRGQFPPPEEGRAGSGRCTFSGGRAASKQCPARGECARRHGRWQVPSMVCEWSGVWAWAPLATVPFLRPPGPGLSQPWEPLHWRNYCHFGFTTIKTSCSHYLFLHWGESHII